VKSVVFCLGESQIAEAQCTVRPWVSYGAAAERVNQSERRWPRGRTLLILVTLNMISPGTGPGGNLWIVPL